MERLTSEYSEACQMVHNCSLHSSRSAGFSSLSSNITHIVSFATVSVTSLIWAAYLLSIGIETFRQVTFLVRLPPPQVLEQSLHSLEFHLYSVRGLQTCRKVKQNCASGVTSVLSCLRDSVTNFPVNYMYIIGCWLRSMNNAQ